LNTDPWDITENEEEMLGGISDNENQMVNFPLSRKRKDEGEFQNSNAEVKTLRYAANQLREKAHELENQLTILRASALQQDASYENMSESFVIAVKKTKDDIERDVQIARHMWSTFKQQV